MIESQLKTVFIENTNFQNELASFLNLDDITIVPEFRFINGITADFVALNNDSIVSIIECKGDDIGVTEYVRGIGQIMQYKYFKDLNVTDNISENCKVYLSFPNTIMSDSSFDISQFSYPNETELLIVNSDNYSPIKINPHQEYKNLKKELDTIRISPYYFRDVRLSEMYMLLLEIMKVYKIQKTQDITRDQIGSILKKYNTVNKNNSRNAFISLSSLGFINSQNHPTLKGFEMSKLEFHDFVSSIVFEYYKPFINEIYRAFDNVQHDNNKYHIQSISNRQIVEIINNFYNGKSIAFLTDSNARYISSWLNSLRDDLGCISFLPKKINKEITINYNPLYSKTKTSFYIKENVNIDYLNKYLNDY